VDKTELCLTDSIVRLTVVFPRHSQCQLIPSPSKARSVLRQLPRWAKAFDAACEELRCPTQQEVIRELIASLIIAAASRRELDPVCLRKVALAGFAIFRPRALPVSATADAVDKEWSPIKRGGVSTC
jgi:hypothetical protein